MLSVLGAAWRVVVKRAVADRLILAAALITILLATTLLAAGPIYADAVALSSLRRSLADAPIPEANVAISLLTPSEGYAANSEIVAEIVPETFGLTGGTIWQRVVSGSYELPGQFRADLTDLGVFESIDRIEDHATIVAGAWPKGAAQPYQAAIPESMAQRLSLRVGDELIMTSRADRSIQPEVRISGIFRINDPEDPFWYEDALLVEGIVESSQFRTHGPLVVGLETLLAGFAPTNTKVTWRVFPTFENLAVSHISPLRQRVQELGPRLAAAQGAGLSFIVDTRLDLILAETERSLLATRSGVLTLTLQMAILAGYALLLTAGLLVESRRIETNLLRSRGAGSRQVLAMAIMEGVVLTVPAAVVAPRLAALALKALNNVGPLASIDLTIEPLVNRSAYVLSFLAAAGCVVALAVPAHRAARSFNESYLARGREQNRAVIHRGGIDIALLVLAALAFWQLQRYGSQITATVQGRLGIDPLLIAAPSLGLLAGAVLALRSIPLMARFAERRAKAGMSAVQALSAWQVARRPARHSRSALLLIMAISMGLFAAAYTSTWKQSQQDQAEYQAGADIRAEPNRRRNDSIPEMNLGGAHARIAAIGESMPVVRQSEQVARSAGLDARFIMLDVTQASSVVRIRDDLSHGSFSTMMTELLAQRPSLATIALPGEPHRIALDFTVGLEPLPGDFEMPANVPEHRIQFKPRLEVVLQDGRDLLHRIDLGPVPVDAGRVRIEGDLVYTMTDGTPAPPVYPLSVVAVEIASPAPLVIARLATLQLHSISTSDTPVGPWSTVDAGFNPESWSLANSRPTGIFAAPSVSPATELSGEGFAFSVNSGVGTEQLSRPVSFSLRPSGTTLPDSFPILVSSGFLELAESRIGDSIRLNSVRRPGALAVIVGSFTSFPTIAPTLGEAVLMDLPTIQMLEYEVGASIRVADERWISAVDNEVRAVAEELVLAPYETHRVVDRVDRAESLLSDPVALGTVAALSLGFVAAAVFAVVGFSVSAVVSARERITEFALLRAVGLSARQLAAWLTVEHGVLVIISLVFGSAIGLLLAWLILPLISITQDATTAVPEVIVAYPWVTIVWLELSLIVVLSVVVAVLARALRRLGLGSLLRLGED
jgi:hypothetical protein